MCSGRPGTIAADVAQLRTEGHEIRDEDVARLSPLKHKSLNVPVVDQHGQCVQAPPLAT